MQGTRTLPTMKSVRRLTSLLLAILLLTACNAKTTPTASVPLVEQLAATLVAATMQAATSAASHGSSQTSTAASAATPTTKPALFIHTDKATCRTGPGTDFKVVATFAAGTTVDMAGKDTTDSYWIVIDPATGSLCWIQAQDATPSGSFDLLPDMTPQASTQTVPAKPTALGWPFFCAYNADGSYTVTTQLSWMDVANNENGYRIYRNGAQIADLPANTTTYKDKVDVPANTAVVYSVEAYNDAGASPQLSTPSAPKSGNKPVACVSP